jgi:hypothetical protein
MRAPKVAAAWAVPMWHRVGCKEKRTGLAAEDRYDVDIM